MTRMAISSTSPPTPKDSAASKVHLDASNKLVDLQARTAFLSDLQGMGTLEVPSSAQGVVVSYSTCRCTLFPSSFQSLIRVRFKLRTEHRVVEGWICSDAIRMLHNLDL